MKQRNPENWGLEAEELWELDITKKDIKEQATLAFWLSLPS